MLDAAPAFVSFILGIILGAAVLFGYQADTRARQVCLEYNTLATCNHLLNR